jgi:hypothetical protein
MMWVENYGRYAPPWNGRNTCLGLEDTCGFLAEGLAASAKDNPIARAGVPTTVKLSPARPTFIRTIQGVVKVPRGFGRVGKMVFSAGCVTLVSSGGKTVAVPVAHEFLKNGLRSLRGE